MSSHSSVSGRSPRSQDNPRVFKPQELYAPGIDVDSAADSDEYFTYVPCWIGELCWACGKLPRHYDQIIIAVDGGCKNNGRPSARASMGVFFAPGSEENFAGILPYENPKLHTSQAAELNACQYALDAALDICDKGLIENIHGRGTLKQVVIKTDSEHLYLGLTERVFKWEENGWLTAAKTPVAHRSIFMQLQRSIADLEDLGVEVLFWWVPRERNRDADGLASSVLY